MSAVLHPWRDGTRASAALVPRAPARPARRRGAPLAARVSARTVAARVASGGVAAVAFPAASALHAAGLLDEAAYLAVALSALLVFTAAILWPDDDGAPGLAADPSLAAPGRPRRPRRLPVSKPNSESAS